MNPRLESRKRPAAKEDIPEMTLQPPIQWTPAMSVGVPELDNDHRRLVGLLNLLAETDEEEDIGVIEEVLDELVVYTTEHFAREEEYMRATNFPGLYEHIAIHEALTRKVEELRMKFFMGEIEHLGKETLAFMKEWLATHILKEDMQYHPDKRR